MTNIIFSFDTEDYVNAYAAEGIYRSAKLLQEEGIKGCFNIVGLLAEALVEWGRQDIIDLIREHHEVTYHAHRHSMHPSINEYTDRADYCGAYKDFVTDESKGIEKVKRIFGVDSITTACPPGDSTSYVAHYAYADMGFTVYDGDHIFDERRSRPIHACNILTTHYNLYGFESYLFTATEESLRELIEKEVANRDTFTFYHHPQRAYCTTFCDIDNFYGVNVPKEEWTISKPRTEEEIATFYRNFRLLVKMLKEDPRFRFITYNELYAQYRSARTLTMEQLPEIRKQLEADWFPVTVPDSYCISDVFLACREMLLGAKEHVCGKVYGFLDTPYAVKQPVKLLKKHFIASAEWMNVDGFLPEYIYVDDKKIGPADWLRAAMAFLLDGVEEYTVVPDKWQLDLNQFPSLRNLRYKNSWVHCKSLEDKYLSDRLRLQTWTFRMKKGTDRKIF